MAFCLGFILLLGACGGPAAGSEEDLSAQLDEFELPASFVELGQHHDGDCPTTCPLLVRWYDSLEPIDATRAEARARLEAAGAIVTEPSTVDVDMLVGRTEDRVFFVVLDTDMIAGNEFAPSGTDVEISLHTRSID